MRTARSERATKRLATAVSPPESSAPWRLPSGQSLAESALDIGLLARRLIEPVRKGAARRGRARTGANQWTGDSSPY
jgi:hypothetical protein